MLPNRLFHADTHRQGAASRVPDHASRGAWPCVPVNSDVRAHERRSCMT
jgi:hypothetical protein